MNPAAEQTLALTSAAVRGAFDLLVFWMAASEWLRTRSEVFLHLRLAFLLRFAGEALTLGSLGAHLFVGKPLLPFVTVLHHVLGAAALVAICHAMAAHASRRRDALESVTTRLLYLTLALGALTLIFKPAWWEKAWEMGTGLLLILAIYLYALLRPSTAVLNALLVLLLGTAAHLGNLFWWGGAHMGLRTVEQFVPALGAALFLWAVHGGIIVEAYTDPLTGLHNKRYFLKRLEEEFDRADRRNRSLSLIILDLDYFKRFNDTKGHVAGDRLLQSVAGILSQHVRGYDVLCRWGGEEFAILLPDTDLETAYQVAERLRSEIAVEHGGITEDTPVTISGGVAAFPFIRGDWEALMEAADEALYEAKVRRNRVEVYTP